MTACLFILKLFFGFFIPGWLLASLWRLPQKFPAALAISLVCLFHIIFWCEVAGIRIEFLPVFLALSSLSLILLALQQKSKRTHLKIKLPAVKFPEAIWLGAALAVGLLLLIRSLLQPLSGWDHALRWDFLAQRILELKHFQYYPPFVAKDFKIYSSVDGIPPLLSFSHWWLYASWGHHDPSVTSFFVLLQYIGILSLTYGIAKKIDSSRTGWLAIGLLAASPLLFQSLFIAQESGLLILSLSGTIYFLIRLEEGQWRQVIMAAIFTSLGCLSREIGLAFIFCGLGMAFWFHAKPKTIILYLLVIFLCSAPWYLRNWVITGNPIYNLRVGSLFPINQVHANLLEEYSKTMDWRTYTPQTLLYFLQMLLLACPLQILLGCSAGILLFKRLGHLTLMSMAVACLWQFGSWHCSTYLNALRFFSPALVPLSVLAAVWLNKISAKKPLNARLIGVLGGVVIGWTFFLDLIYPQTISGAAGLAVQLKRSFTPKVTISLYTPLKRELPTLIPEPARILTDSFYAQPGFYGSAYDLVTIFNPEVEFLFQKRMDAATIKKQLLEKDIQYVLFQHDSVLSPALKQFAFFSDTKDWKVILERPYFGLYSLTD